MRKFKVGDSVHFKTGIRHVDLDLDIGGWQGRVDYDPESTADGVVPVVLDSVTLAALSAEYIIDTEQNGLGWHIYYEETDNLERAKPRDTPAQAEVTYAELSHRFRWVSFEAEGIAIQEIVQEVDDHSWEALQRWYDYFSNVLTFPFEAVVSEWSSHGGHVRIGDKVRVQALSEIDDHVGILVTVKRRYSTFELPLCDLEVRDKSAPQHDPIQLYAVWLANR